MGLQKRSSTVTVIPEAPSRSKAPGDGLRVERQIKADRPGEADGRRSGRPEEPRLGSPAAPDHRDGTAVPAQSVACWLGQKPPPLARPGFHSVTGNSPLTSAPPTDDPSSRVMSY